MPRLSEKVKQKLRVLEGLPAKPEKPDKREYGSGSYRLKGSKYYIRFYHPVSGKRVEEVTDVTHEKDLKEYIRKRIVAESENAPKGLVSAPKRVLRSLTVMDIVDHYQEGRNTELRERLAREGSTEREIEKALKSDQRFLEQLRPFFRDILWTELETKHSVAYQNWRRKQFCKNGDNAKAGTARGRKKNVSFGTIDRELTVLRAAVNKLIKDGDDLARMVIIRLKGIKVVRKGFVTPERFLTALLPELNKPERRHIRDLIIFLYCSGCRTSEALRLKWEHVYMSSPDPGKWSVLILKSKNGDQREVPIFKGIMRETFIRMKERIDRLGLKNQYVFASIKRDEKGIGSFKRAWKTAVKNAGVTAEDGTYLRPHDLRRSAARNMRNADISAEAMMKFMGHKSHSMLLRYNIISQEELRHAREKMDEASRGWGQFEVA